MRNLLTCAALAACATIVAATGCGSSDVDGISAGGAGGLGGAGFDSGTLDASTGGTGGTGGTTGTGGTSGAAGSGGSGGSPCTSDDQPCASSAQCCSGTCSAAGVCAPLNPSCRTMGNTCATHGDCCSKLCRSGVCASGSFCTQNGDVCAAHNECCGGLCDKAAGATLGTCGQTKPPGVPGCTVAGVACGGVVDGGGGIPECGGECCSRACAPHRSGLLVCQPPSGCRPTGEICATNSDCCGAVGFPGSSGVECSKANPSDPVGRCDNGQACRAAGAICKLATMSCNAENNCCSGNVNQNPFACQQDILGIPRCTMTGQPCSDGGSKAGQACATSADCCGLACVPNPGFTADAGVPPFVCGGECIGRGGSCTTAADCCPGLPCTLPPGSTRGVCGPPPSGDAGPPADGSTSDVDIPDGPKPPCAEYGQVCTTKSDCCNGVPCTDGRCVYIPK